MNFRGNRKMLMCVLYLGACCILDIMAIGRMDVFDLASMSGLAALNISLASGVGVVVAGNVKVAQANGK